MKPFFQKLLLSIPLRPNIAAIFALILGTLGLFLPWVYLSITAPDSAGTTTSIVLPQTEITGVFDLGYCEAFGAKMLVQPPKWLNDGFWNGYIRIMPLILGISYYSKFGPEKFKKALWKISLSGFALVLIFAIGFAPKRILCDFNVQVIIHGYTISWFSIIVSFIGILLGFFAYYKQELLRAIESQE